MPLSDFPPRTIALMAANDARKAVAELKRKRQTATDAADAMAAVAALKDLASNLADILKEIA